MIVFNYSACRVEKQFKVLFVYPVHIKQHTPSMADW